VCLSFRIGIKHFKGKGVCLSFRIRIKRFKGKGVCLSFRIRIKRFKGKGLCLSFRIRIKRFKGKGVCLSFRIRIRTSDKRVNYSHGPAQTEQHVGWCVVGTLLVHKQAIDIHKLTKFTTTQIWGKPLPSPL
jgi:hypothetical protein